MSPSEIKAARDAALVRMAEILDRAAEHEGVSRAELCAGLTEAIESATHLHSGTSSGCTPEEFVLSAVSMLF